MECGWFITDVLLVRLLLLPFCYYCRLPSPSPAAKPRAATDGAASNIVSRFFPPFLSQLAPPAAAAGLKQQQQQEAQQPSQQTRRGPEDSAEAAAGGTAGGEASPAHVRSRSPIPFAADQEAGSSSNSSSEEASDVGFGRIPVSHGHGER